MLIPKSFVTFYGGVGWFWAVRGVWLLPGSVLVWTDHNGYDKGLIRGASQEDVVRVLKEVFLT